MTDSTRANLVEMEDVEPASEERLETARRAAIHTALTFSHLPVYVNRLGFTLGQQEAIVVERGWLVRQESGEVVLLENPEDALEMMRLLEIHRHSEHLEESRRALRYLTGRVTRSPEYET